MNFEPHIKRLQERMEELERLIADPNLYSDNQRAQTLLREHRQVKQALQDHRDLSVLERQLTETEQLAENREDPEMSAMALEEIPAIEKNLEDARRRFVAGLIPPDPSDSRNVIVEIRAGTGGNEAALFASDLFRMYSRFVERVQWKIEVLDSSPSDLGGYKEIVFQISGEDAFKKMRFESGVHRVQRVPATESQGRIHTSAASVAVLPEAREVDLVIKPEDIRVEVCRAGGPGGQGVNTTDSAVQILHIPSGVIVRCQDSRSQIKNREKAVDILRARLLEKKQAEESAQYAATRKAQIGSGDRNEKIRTYNYPQNRITDHRINFTLYNLETFMDGSIQNLLDALLAADTEMKLSQLQSS